MSENTEARKQILRFLERMDRTEAELRKKLAEKGYESWAIDDAVAYAFSYGYINDRRYAENYVRIFRAKKSVLRIRMELLEKGVDAEIIEDVLTENGDSDTELARSLLRRRLQGKNATYEELAKCRGWLYRRGFRAETIRQVLSEYGEEFGSGADDEVCP